MSRPKKVADEGTALTISTRPKTDSIVSSATPVKSAHRASRHVNAPHTTKRADSTKIPIAREIPSGDGDIIAAKPGSNDNTPTTKKAFAAVRMRVVGCVWEPGTGKSLWRISRDGIVEA